MASSSTCSPSLILDFALLILAFAVSTRAAPAPALEEVLDTTGKKVVTGADYNILPANQGRAGGVGLGPSRKETCPLHVIQEIYDYWEGVPVKFLPAKKGTVRVSTDLNIKFDAETSCNETTVWKLAPFDKEVRQYFVSIGGSVGNPGPKTLSSWFKIEKYGEHYKISYCPSVCKSCKVICRDIGIYLDEKDNRHLALSWTPFQVMFKKKV